jgi:glutamine synthetase type III
MSNAMTSLSFVYETPNRFNAYVAAVNSGEELTHKYADKVAKAMQKWAVERGAVNYTHGT